MAKEASANEFAQDFCIGVVYTAMELGEPIESILHWTIMKFNVVIKMIGEINKRRYGGTSAGRTNTRTIG